METRPGGSTSGGEGVASRHKERWRERDHTLTCYSCKKKTIQKQGFACCSVATRTRFGRRVWLPVVARRRNPKPME